MEIISLILAVTILLLCWKLISKIDGLVEIIQELSVKNKKLNDLMDQKEKNNIVLLNKNTELQRTITAIKEIEESTKTILDKDNEIKELLFPKK